jgi:hypothetical protein
LSVGLSRNMNYIIGLFMHNTVLPEGATR